MGPLKNPRHENFVRAVFEGKTAKQAYRIAVSQTCTETTAETAGCDLLTIPRIKARLEELKNTPVTGIVLTRDWLVEQMVDTAAQAAADRAHAPRTRALELLGREKGAFTERKDLVVRSFANLSTEEIEELLAGEPAPGASGKSGGSLAGGTGAKKARGRKQG